MGLVKRKQKYRQHIKGRLPPSTPWTDQQLILSETLEKNECGMSHAIREIFAFFS